MDEHGAGDRGGSNPDRTYEKKHAIAETGVDLMARARTLAHVYKLPVPRKITWVTNQNTLWGSCSFDDGVVRLSSRLLTTPD